MQRKARNVWSFQNHMTTSIQEVFLELSLALRNILALLSLPPALRYPLDLVCFAFTAHLAWLI
jgi:hypothetical protein